MCKIYCTAYSVSIWCICRGKLSTGITCERERNVLARSIIHSETRRQKPSEPSLLLTLIWSSQCSHWNWPNLFRDVYFLLFALISISHGCDESPLNWNPWTMHGSFWVIIEMFKGQKCREPSLSHHHWDTRSKTGTFPPCRKLCSMERT